MIVHMMYKKDEIVYRLHRPSMAGIWSGNTAGSSASTPSIVLSGGYDDDIDEGESIIYTGQGGQGIDG